jgi:hypothetical protein
MFAPARFSPEQRSRVHALGEAIFITQRIVLSGAIASAFAEQVQVNFSATLGDGMNRTAGAMGAGRALSGDRQ